MSATVRVVTPDQSTVDPEYRLMNFSRVCVECPHAYSVAPIPTSALDDEWQMDDARTEALRTWNRYAHCDCVVTKEEAREDGGER